MFLLFRREAATGERETLVRIETNWIVVAVLIVVLILLGLPVGDVVLILKGLARGG